LLKQVPWFNGEVLCDNFGNIYGRLNGITKGECIKGYFNDWSKLDGYKFPPYNADYYPELKKRVACCDKYVVAHLPVSGFSTFRDIRLMANALIDTLTERKNVLKFLDLIRESVDEICAGLAGTGVDAIMFGDDWGTQTGTFISEQSFIELFKPLYKDICNSANSRGMRVFMHSCGKNHAFIPHLAEAGVDVFQFDQPDIYPASWLADNFGKKATFYCPVDIQRVMPTGDKKLIMESALKLVNTFKAAGGSFIAKDYPSWHDLNVQEEWAAWAREAFINNAIIFQ